MDWILVIVFLGQAGLADPESIAFETRSECISAAEEFVAMFPVFKFRRRPMFDPALAVDGSYVECKWIASERD